MLSNSEYKNTGKSLIKKSIGISILVSIGKMLGFLKQAVIAWAFGANALTDLYFAADSFVVMFGQIEHASIAPAVLTGYIHLKENKKNSLANYFIRKCYVYFPIIALCIIAIILLFTEPISAVLGISYSYEDRQMLQKLIIYLCPVILFSSFSAVSQGILEGNEKFFPTSLLSLFFSISVIVFVIAFRQTLGIFSLLLGFLVGYGSHTILVTILAKKYYSFGRFLNKNMSFSSVLRITLPLVIGNSMVDIGHLVDRIIASSLPNGSISFLYYGQVVSNDIINAIIITSVGTVMFPSFTKMVASGNNEERLVDSINRVVCVMTTLLIGIMGLYVVEGNDLVKIFFERGNFSNQSTEHVTRIAICYSFGFVFIAIREVLTKVYYAFQDTTTPMRNGIIGVIINILLSWLLSRCCETVGIALATSISMAVVAFLMLFSARKLFKRYLMPIGFWKSFFESALSVSISSLIGFELRRLLISMNIVFRMVLISSTFLMCYICALVIFNHDAIKILKELRSGVR